MEIAYREGKDGINNLMTIYSVITGKNYEQIEQEFAGKGYGDFKTAVGEAVAEELRPVRENFERYSKIKHICRKCTAKVRNKQSVSLAEPWKKVYKKVGFLPR